MGVISFPGWSPQLCALAVCSKRGDVLEKRTGKVMSFSFGGDGREMIFKKKETTPGAIRMTTDG